MKKFLFIIGMMLLSAALMAQTSGTVYTLSPNVTYYSAFNKTHTTRWANADVKDSIGGTATKYWIFAVNKSQLYYYQFLFEYDTVLTAGRVVGNHVTFSTYGSIDGNYWTKLDSALFHPTTMWLPDAQAAKATADVASLKDVSTGVLWRYLKFEAKGGDANKCSICSKLALKVGLRY